MFLKYANLSKNFNEFLFISLDKNLISYLNNGSVGIKLLEYISNNHLDDINRLMKDCSMKCNWYLNSKKLFRIDNFFLQTLTNLFKYVYKFEYKAFERIVTNHLNLYKLVCFDLDYFDSKFDISSLKKTIILYNDEKVLTRFLQVIISSGILKQFQIPLFINCIIENFFNKLEHSYLDLLEYLYYHIDEILTLKQLCRIKIRINLISYDEKTIFKLPLPISLKKYMNYNDIFQ